MRPGGEPAAFVGNDVVDLASSIVARRAGEAPQTQDEWVSRHVTPGERADLDRGAPFWSLFAVKEAASKAFAQAGVAVTPGAFRDFEVDLSQRRVRHRPTGLEGEIARLDESREAVHAVVVYPAAARARRLAARLDRLEAGEDASEGARAALARLLAEASAGGATPSRFAVTTDGGVPRVLEAGTWRDWSVSFSHSGRFVAASALLP